MDKKTPFILSALLSAIAGISLGYHTTNHEEISISEIPPKAAASLPESPVSADPAKIPQRTAGQSDLDYTLQSLSEIRELTRWNPHRAFAAALRIHDETGESMLLGEVIETGATTDAKMSIDSFLTLSPELQNEHLEGLANAVIEKNPKGAIHLFESGIIEDCEKESLGRAFQAFAGNHRDKAAGWLLENKEASSGIDDIVSPFLTVPGGLESIISVLGSEFSSRISDAPREGMLSYLIITEHLDPETAMAFVDTISDPVAKDIYNFAIASNLLNDDPNLAVDHFTNTLSSSSITEASDLFLSLLAASDLDLALETGKRTMSTDQLEALIPQMLDVATSYGIELPESQVQGYIDRINSGQDLTDQEMLTQAMVIINELCSGTRALEWVNQIDDSNDNDLKLLVLYHMASRNIEINPRVSSEAIAALPESADSDHRDDLVSKLIDSVSYDPERALQWTSFIKDPELRATTLGSVTEVLRSYEPEEVLSWLNTAPFSPDEIARVRQAISVDGVLNSSNP